MIKPQEMAKRLGISARTLQEWDRTENLLHIERRPIEDITQRINTKTI